MSLAFMTRNASATHRLRSKIFTFLNELEPEQYADNQDICWRISLAYSIGNAVLKCGARTFPAIEHRVMEDTDWADYHAGFFDSYKLNTGHATEGFVIENELDNEQILYIDNYVSTRLRYAYIWRAAPAFREIADRIDSGDMGEISLFNDDVLAVLEGVVRRGRQVKTSSRHESQDFATGNNSFEAAIRAAHAQRNKPQSVVKTGVRYMNEMLNGGYEGSRVYVHFGRSGDWKSGQLICSAMWACDPRFNPSYETQDPTRKAAVLFVTKSLVHRVVMPVANFSNCWKNLRAFSPQRGL